MRRAGSARRDQGPEEKGRGLRESPAEHDAKDSSGRLAVPRVQCQRSPWTSGAKETSTAKDSSTITEDTGTGNPTGDKACGAEATLQDCGTCCIANHKSGYTVFQNSLLACACKGTGADGGAPCSTDCAATICAATPKNADATCNTCLQGSISTGGACQEQLTTDCTADADCVAEQSCVAQCKGKP